MNSKSKNSTIKYKVIGLMSGTSLDGLDIACCTFTKKETWSFRIDVCETIRYSPTWKTKLANAHTLAAASLIELHCAYGELLGECVKNFISKHALRNIDFVASHGHTVFHQPQKKFTFQLGDGNALHAACGLPVIFDFRSLDVAHGGQGAPLVPVGDKFLFSEYDVCLNLGGIANLSRDVRGKRMAFDICYANMGLNYLAQKAGREYDKEGTLAAQGSVDRRLLAALTKRYNSLRNNRPSLAREGFEKLFLPLLEDPTAPLQDRLHTFVESIALEVAVAFGKTKPQTVLVTGGGAFNNFLMYRLVEFCGDENQLVLPDDNIIKFKEALVFAFLGVLKKEGLVNALQSVTGASRNTSGGLTIGF